MNCPACGRGLPAGLSERCPFCASLLAPPAEGALAPNVSPFASALLGPEEPLREIPGLRKRERTWKDEVKDRVSDRRRTRGGEPAGTEIVADAGERDQEAPLEGAPATPNVNGAAVPRPEPPGAGLRLRELDDAVARLTDPQELLLRPLDQGEAVSEPEPPGMASAPRTLSIAIDPEEEPEADDWSLGTPVAGEAAAPVERPAAAFERLLAGVLDTLFWGGLAAAVVYFASRIARVAPWGLRPVWPYLVGYLAFLGLSYAVYFTGTTGQTLGKMATRLRVVDSQGRPPVYGRALARVVAGSLGVLLAALGLLPMLFDPARRTLHDRLTRTRVVKSA